MTETVEMILKVGVIFFSTRGIIVFLNKQLEKVYPVTFLFKEDVVSFLITVFPCTVKYGGMGFLLIVLATYLSSMWLKNK